MNRRLDQPKRWQEAVKSITATRPVAWLLARVLHHIDAAIIKLTSGRHSATEIMTGLPILVLTTTGARTGKPHVVPLLALREGDNLVLIASNFGQSHHPAWYYNLCANPEVSVSIGGFSRTYYAGEVDGAEREGYWNRVVKLYKGYDAYKDRARGRKIPVIVLTPTT
jgi:deazaflavin-dependent oxidoreductase (nitroreductase family)